MRPCPLCPGGRPRVPLVATAACQAGALSGVPGARPLEEAGPACLDPSASHGCGAPRARYRPTDDRKAPRARNRPAACPRGKGAGYGEVQEADEGAPRAWRGRPGCWSGRSGRGGEGTSEGIGELLAGRPVGRGGAAMQSATMQSAALKARQANGKRSATPGRYELLTSTPRSRRCPA